MDKKIAYYITITVVLLFGVFFLYPVGMTLATAFRSEGGGFTMDYIFAVFKNPVYREGLWNSLMMGIFSWCSDCLYLVVCGVGSAIGI